MGDQAYFCGFINLDRSSDRRRRIEAQLAHAGVEAVRIAAADGGVADACYRPDWRRWIGGQLSAGEIGCAESHRRALRCLVDSGAPFGIILEDDAELAPEFMSVVDHVIRQTAGWDLVRLEQRKRGVLAPTGLRLAAGRTLAVPRNMTFGSTAMLYSARGARLALASLDRGYMQPVDAHLGSLAGPGFVFLQLTPPVVTERLEASLIGPRAELAGSAQRNSGSRVGGQRLCSGVLRLLRSSIRRTVARRTARLVRRLSAQSGMRSIFIPAAKADWMLAGRSLHERNAYPDRQPVDPSRRGGGVRGL